MELAPYTYIRIGGRAEAFWEVRSLEDLRQALAWRREREIPECLVLGGGANLLVNDERTYPLVIKLERELGALREEPGRIVAQAGVYLSRLVREGVRAGWGGVERLAGIPGTLGGAVAMNAGIPSFEIFDLVQEVRGVDERGADVRFTPAELRPGYRQGNVPEGVVVTEVVLARGAGDPRAMAAAARELKEQRRAKQPLQFPSFGSTFVNPGPRPGNGDAPGAPADVGWGASAAGALLERAGLKGARRGDAQLSEMHANFVVNLGRARSRDVLDLMVLARRTVAERFGVWLEPEVRLAGFSPEDLLPLRETGA
ncbi:MAG: UDP-N-acetylmuramate dehydrogenase [Gemmatimonadota bacterium]